MTRRHQVRPPRLARQPNAPASTKASHQGRDLLPSAYTAQAAAQVNKAGRGQKFTANKRDMGDGGAD
ncbi:hypothetical protein GCM10010975_32800 [Comamonas phosphati]|nr:hypothetical protein GCM10010975_32800 [Comamonas phosphati]